MYVARGANRHDRECFDQTRQGATDSGGFVSHGHGLILLHRTACTGLRASASMLLRLGSQSALTLDVTVKAQIQRGSEATVMQNPK